MGTLANHLRKTTALAALTLSPSGYAAAQQQSAGIQHQATIAAADNPDDKAALPNAPVPSMIVQAPRPAENHDGLFEKAAHMAHDVDTAENKMHLRAHVDRHQVELTAPLRGDTSYNQPDSSASMIGLTSGVKNGIRQGWTADLFARQRFRDGGLNPGEATRSYGGEIETHVTARKGRISLQGQVKAIGGEERFKAYLTQGEMDAELAAQGVPSAFYPPGEAAIKASLPTTNQPLITGRASAVAELDPKFTYVKKGPFLAGLTRLDVGGDLDYGSLGHGRQKEICATGLNFGNSIAVSACEESGVAGGHDDPHAARGLHFNMAVDTSELAADAEKILGRHTARNALASKKDAGQNKGK